MGLLAVILLVVWLLGIVAMTYSVAYTLKHDNSETTQKVRYIMEIQPVVLSAFLAVLIIAWPATLAYSLATKRNR